MRGAGEAFARNGEKCIQELYGMIEMCVYAAYFFGGGYAVSYDVNLLWSVSCRTR